MTDLPSPLIPGPSTLDRALTVLEQHRLYGRLCTTQHGVFWPDKPAHWRHVVEVLQAAGLLASTPRVPITLEQLRSRLYGDVVWDSTDIAWVLTERGALDDQWTAPVYLATADESPDPAATRAYAVRSSRDLHTGRGPLFLTSLRQD